MRNIIVTPMTPTITAFERSPDRGQGLARDMRVRWALEEVGQAYDVRLVSFDEMKQPAHLARPAYKRAFADQLAVFTGDRARRCLSLNGDRRADGDTLPVGALSD
jgi:hypothetical protein